LEHKEDIEQLFKNTFENFESDVHSDAWMNIQNSLNVQHASQAASSSTGAKIATVSSKMGVTAIIGTTAAIIGITVSIIYFTSNNKKIEITKPVQRAEAPVQTEATLQNSENSSVKNEMTVPEKSNSLISSKTIKHNTGNNIINSNSDNPGKDFKEAISTNANLKNEMGNYFTKSEEDDNKNNQDLNLIKAENPTTTSELGPDVRLSEVPKEEEPVLNNISESSSPERKTSETSEIEIEKYLGKIHDVITPNADGKNDAFVINGKGLQTLQVRIFDRSSKLIHHWNNLHGFWDGKLENGDPTEAGIYFYNIFALTAEGKPISIKGPLYLILK